MGIKLIKEVARRSSDVDGLSPADRRTVIARYGKRISAHKLKKILDIFKDHVVTKSERRRLRWLLGYRAFRALNHVVGKDGRQLLRNHSLAQLISPRTSIGEFNKILKKLSVKPGSLKFGSQYLSSMVYLKYGLSFRQRPPDDTFLVILSNHLLAAYDAHDPRPLAVQIQPTADYNGAYRLTGQGKIQAQLLRGYLLRYYEAGTDREAIRAIKDATKRRKASLIEIRGHGNKRSLQLGKGWHERFSIDIGDRNKLKGMSNVVVDGGHILLASCLTGKGGRRAHNLVNFMSRIFPQAYVHGEMVSSSRYLLFDRYYRFRRRYSINRKFRNTQRDKDMVVRRNNGFYVGYDTQGRYKGFPHPQHATKATRRTWHSKLKQLLKGHPHFAVRFAAGNTLKLSRGKSSKYAYEATYYDILSVDKWIGILLKKIKVHPQVYMYVARRAAESKDSRVIPALLEASQNNDISDATTLMRVIEGIAKFNGSNVIRILAHIALHNASPFVKKHALVQLARKKHSLVLPTLIKALKANEKHPFVRETCVKLLGKMGDKRALPILRRTAGDNQQEFYVRTAAINALRANRDSAALPLYLLYILTSKESSDVSYFAAHKVKKLSGDPIPWLSSYLIGSLGRKSTRVRIRTAQVMRHLQNEHACPALLFAMAYDSDSDVRNEALYSLLKMGRKVIPYLEAYKECPDASIRYWARYTLQRIKEQKVTKST